MPSDLTPQQREAETRNSVAQLLWLVTHLIDKNGDYNRGATKEDFQNLRGHADALLALGWGPAPASAVRIKPLVWTTTESDGQLGFTHITAQTIFGRVTIGGHAGGGSWTCSTGFRGRTLAGVQREVQRQHDAAILSALEPQPATASARAGAEAMRLFSVAAIARSAFSGGERVGYRMMLANARSKEEAIGVALRVFEERHPQTSFSDADALEVTGQSLPAAEVTDEDVERAAKAGWDKAEHLWTWDPANPVRQWPPHGVLADEWREITRAALLAYLAPR